MTHLVPPTPKLQRESLVPPSSIIPGDRCRSGQALIAAAAGGQQIHWRDQNPSNATSFLTTLSIELQTEVLSVMPVNLRIRTKITIGFVPLLLAIVGGMGVLSLGWITEGNNAVVRHGLPRNNQD